MMVITYGLLLISVLLFSIVFRNYKKSLIKDLNKKEHPFIFFYGCVMFLEDNVLSKLKFIKDEKMVKTLKALFIREKVEPILYLAKVKKCAMCICVFSLFIGIGLFKSIVEYSNQNQYLTTLERPESGNGSKNYNLNAIVGKEKTLFPIQIEIGEIALTQEEIDEKITLAIQKLNELVLGENDTRDNITKPINLVTQIDDIEVSWQIQDPELIDYNGKIYQENVEEEGALTYIIATLSYGDIDRTTEIALVIKALTDEDVPLEEQIQNSINKNNSLYNSDVSLPSIIEDEEIVYQNVNDNQSGIFLMFAIVSSAILLYVQNKELANKVKKRNEQMLMDYPEIVSKLTLLSEAGLSISRAWDRVVSDYEKDKIVNKLRYAYEEMRLTNIKMKNGTPEGMSYAEFGKRCNLQCYLKLGGLLEQNVTKGTKGLKNLLEQEVRDAFESRKNYAKIRGEEASTKLLVPMVLMLVIVIVIIVVPAFLSMNI